jgi:hypothetical protein
MGIIPGRDVAQAQYAQTTTDGPLIALNVGGVWEPCGYGDVRANEQCSAFVDFDRHEP